MLKNQLHATATEVSMFRLVTGIPVYFAFVFGLMRDLWNPLGLRDRGFFLIFAPITAIAFMGMALSRLSYQGLLIGMLTGDAVVPVHRRGLSGIDRLDRPGEAHVRPPEHAVEYGQLRPGPHWSIRLRIHLRTSAAEGDFFLVAALAFLIALLGLWKPSFGLRDTYDKPQARGRIFGETSSGW